MSVDFYVSAEPDWVLHDMMVMVARDEADIFMHKSYCGLHQGSMNAAETVIQCGQPKYGRFVQVQKNAVGTYFRFNELEVWGYK